MINEARLADHLSLLLTLFSRVVTFITDALIKQLRSLKSALRPCLLFRHTGSSLINHPE